MQPLCAGTFFSKSVTSHPVLFSQCSRPATTPPPASPSPVPHPSFMELFIWKLFITSEISNSTSCSHKTTSRHFCQPHSCIPVSGLTATMTSALPSAHHVLPVHSSWASFSAALFTPKESHALPWLDGLPNQLLVSWTTYENQLTWASCWKCWPLVSQHSRCSLHLLTSTRTVRLCLGDTSSQKPSLIIPSILAFVSHCLSHVLTTPMLPLPMQHTYIHELFCTDRVILAH